MIKEIDLIHPQFDWLNLTLEDEQKG